MEDSWKIKNDNDAEFIIDKCYEDLIEISRFKISLEEKIKNLKDKLKMLKNEEDSIKGRRFDKRKKRFLFNRIL